MASHINYMNYKISYDRALQFLLHETQGRIFTAFIAKNDNSIHEMRVMNCRRGVNKYVNGKGMCYNPESMYLITVFDMQKRAYRTIDMKKLYFFKINKEIYFVQ